MTAHSKRFHAPLALAVSALCLGALMLLFMHATEEPKEPLSDKAPTPLSSPWPKTLVVDGYPERDVPNLGEIPAETYAWAEVSPLPAAPFEEVVPFWHEKINEVLNASGEGPAKNTAEQLAQMLPTLPVEGQVEVALNLVALLQDSDYELARYWLLQPTLPLPVMEVFFEDLLLRPNTLRLPLLSEVASVPGHPQSVEAAQILSAQTGRELGPGPVNWAPAIEQALRQEAAEALAEGPQSPDEGWIEVDEASKEPSH